MGNIFLPVSICLTCANATPLKCYWMACNNDNDQMAIALQGKEYESKIDCYGIEIVSIQKCPNYKEG